MNKTLNQATPKTHDCCSTVRKHHVIGDIAHALLILGLTSPSLIGGSINFLCFIL